MSRPRTLVCYLCGNEFGTKSLLIHIPQCQQKWLTAEASKPPKERRALPAAPNELEWVSSANRLSEADIDEFNDRMYHLWETRGLMTCKHCGRSFKEEAFKRHSKGCTAASPSKPAGTGLTRACLSVSGPKGAISGTKHDSSHLLAALEHGQSVREAQEQTQGGARIGSSRPASASTDNRNGTNIQPRPPTGPRPAWGRSVFPSERSLSAARPSLSLEAVSAQGQEGSARVASVDGAMSQEGRAAAARASASQMEASAEARQATTRPGSGRPHARSTATSVSPGTTAAVTPIPSLENLAEWRSGQASLLPAEPAAGTADVVTCLIRTGDGARLVRRVMPSMQLEVLFNLVDAMSSETPNVCLTAYPATREVPVC
ncbi:hypothetical protein CYMTET_16918 [Cymbomonas tetramitiformis]|uniref:Uncharacterized protein n=1 Tax=Cymbomonas tetramitiformis TaxID=36881 RepID=A0AAE0GB85_9CHLO|nr:hypothetical protein CYMTET_16918 [Cymbomonas tetramitiformis]